MIGFLKLFFFFNFNRSSLPGREDLHHVRWQGAVAEQKDGNHAEDTEKTICWKTSKIGNFLKTKSINFE